MTGPKRVMKLFLTEAGARMNETVSRERRFTSDVAHELRTPLTAIKTHLQVVRITHGQEAAVAMAFTRKRGWRGCSTRSRSC